ncbi:MAG TPA: MFS transporter [Chloroflexota bacterium]
MVPIRLQVVVTLPTACVTLYDMSTPTHHATAADRPLARRADEAWRGQLVLVSAAFLAAFAYATTIPAVPIFLFDLLEGDLQAASFWTGLAFGANPLGTALTGPLWSALGDRWGQRVMVLRAFAALAVATALTPLAADPLQVLGLRFAIGALGGYSAALLAAAASDSPPHRVGRAVGATQAAQILGQVVGPLTGGGLLVVVGPTPVFFVAAALFVVAIVFFALAYRPSRERGGAPKREAPTLGLLEVLRSSGLGPLFVVIFVVAFVERSLDPLLPFYLQAYGAPRSLVGLLAGVGVALGGLTAALAAAWGGRLGDAQRPRALTLGLLLCGVLCLVALVANLWWHLLLYRALVGVAAGAVPSVVYALAAGRAASGRRGTTVGLLYSAGLIGWAVGPPLAGSLVGWDLRAIFVVSLALFLGAWVLWRRRWRRFGQGVGA